MKSTAATWADLWRPWLADARRFNILRWTITLALPFAVWLAPWPTLGVAVVTAVAVWFWRDTSAIVLVLIALKGNSKLHLYTGGLTIFPEYPFILIACAVWVMQRLEGRPWVGERRLLLLFGWFVLAGFASFIHALNVPRVFTKGGVVLISFVIFALTLHGVRSERQLGRAMTWIVWSTAVIAVYSVLQVAAPFAGFNVNLDFMEQYGNPDFYYGIGAPVIYQFTKIFRANGLFNDSNILAGFVAALTPLVLAMLVLHAQQKRRLVVVAEGALLFVLALTMLFTLSRSGLIALAAGLGIVLLFMPRILRSPAFWTTGAVAVTAAILLSAAMGVDPFVLWVRMGETFNLGDFSNRQHFAAADFAIRLFLRFPLIGAGLRNFGYNYANEVDPHYPNMIAHNAFLGYFAETGLLGGVPFVLLIGLILWRTWRTARDRRLPVAAPHLYAWTVGLLGSLVALTVSNLFYDFYLRTFTWVLTGLAVVAARLWSQRAGEKGAERAAA